MIRPISVQKFQQGLVILATAILMVTWVAVEDAITIRYVASFVMGLTAMYLAGVLYSSFIGEVNGENPGSGRRD